MPAELERAVRSVPHRVADATAALPGPAPKEPDKPTPAVPVLSQPALPLPNASSMQVGVVSAPAEAGSSRRYRAAPVGAA
jgi:hypothetical protein